MIIALMATGRDDCPESIKVLANKIAKRLVDSGHEVRVQTNAVGVGRSFLQGILRSTNPSPKVVQYSPYEGYGWAITDLPVLVTREQDTEGLKCLVKDFWHRLGESSYLSTGSLKFYLRNLNMLVGGNLDRINFAELLIYYSEYDHVGRGLNNGGVLLAAQTARGLGIPAINLANPKCLELLTEILGSR